MDDCTPQEQDSARITTSSDVIADLHDEIARLERELSHALQAADVEAREADRLRAHPAPREPLIARALDEWHEDDGPVMWWAWCGGHWAGEPAWCGTPNDSDWPGYHTHWTPHPDQPAHKEQTNG